MYVHSTTSRTTRVLEGPCGRQEFTGVVRSRYATETVRRVGHLGDRLVEKIKYIRSCVNEVEVGRRVPRKQ